MSGRLRQLEGQCSLGNHVIFQFESDYCCASFLFGYLYWMITKGVRMNISFITESESDVIL